MLGVGPGDRGSPNFEFSYRALNLLECLGFGMLEVWNPVTSELAEHV